MVEDALKTCRNLHRLIIAVNVAAIVFALSISRPEDDSLVVEQIESFEQVDFAKYPDWADDLAQRQYAKRHQKMIAAFAEELGKIDSLVFNIHHIADVAGTSPHVSRLLVEDTMLVSGDAAKIDAIEQLLSPLYHVGRDVQIWVPDLSRELIQDISNFINENGTTGSRIDNVRIEMQTAPILSSPHNFVPTEEAFAQIYFEIVPPQGGGPVFTRDLKCTIEEVPNTSLLQWLQFNGQSSKALKIDAGKIQVFPELRPFSKGFSQKTIGEARNTALDNIRSMSPESQSITLLGTKVPGQLATIAAPVVSTLLLFYLAAHLPHMRRLMDRHSDEIAEFAWLALQPGRSWLIDVTGTLVVLPMIAFIIMNIRLSAFETSRVAIFLVSTISTALGVVAALLIVQYLKTIRARFSKTN